MWSSKGKVGLTQSVSRAFMFETRLKPVSKFIKQEPVWTSNSVIIRMLIQRFKRHKRVCHIETLLSQRHFKMFEMGLKLFETGFKLFKTRLFLL